jgi:ribulose-phosphate 3-epimerase
MGPPVVRALAERIHDAGAAIDVHLMVDRPERHVDDFARAGADSITIHVEATPHVHYTLQAIRAAGCGAGLALCPATPPVAAAEVAADLDVLLCMTVNPGWGGQAFIPASVAKLEQLREMLGPDTALEVDGGIDAATAAWCAAAGATLFVAGTSVFGSPDPAAAVREIATAAQTA